MLDGSFVPKKGGEDIASGWKGKGSTVHLVTEGEGLPLAFLVTRVMTGADFRYGLWRRRIQPSIPHREWPNRRRRPGRPPETHEASKSRWKMERSHGWLDNWRRLVTRYDWYTQSYVAFLTIACFMATLSRILA